MFVIGTAGHVDHGKSTLVKALTGIDPDRLPQEKERGMTIDLGFAWVTLPSGREVSIVDVPGHERFIKNMLAGVGGIDLALLVVAADEGVMPQTREHLAILDLLEVGRGVVAITKADLVDQEWLELVKADVEDALRGTALEGAPMLAVSAFTGQGLDQLKATLDQMLASTEPPRDLGRPRLPIDRSFTVAGFGTVVTGTLMDGSLSVGQEVELVLSGQRSRIRGLQTHRKKVETAVPGSRVAVNLSGVSHTDIRRGEVLTIPGWLHPTTMLDARVRMVRDAPRGLKHNAGVTFHALAAESLARVRLLDADELKAGQEGWVQVHLMQPVAVTRGDYFVLRSSDATLGGGRVVDPSPRRHRRHHQPTLERLAVLQQGSRSDVLLQALEARGPLDLPTLARHVNLSQEEAAAQLRELAASGRAVLLAADSSDAGLVAYAATAWSDLKSRARDLVGRYHAQYPLRKGLPREELRSRLGVSPALAPRIIARLVQEGDLAEEGPLVRLPGHRATPSAAQRQQAEAYLRALESQPYSPPTDLAIDPELLALLVYEGRAVKVADSLVFAAWAYQEMVEKIVQHIRQHGKITVAEARDLLGTSRKYVLPLLEYLDQQRVTRRVGDDRVLRRADSEGA